MIRRLLKTAVCEAASWVRLDAWLEDRGPIILGYHRVVDDPRAPGLMPGLVIGVRTLERQLECVGRRRRFVTLVEAADLLGRRAGSLVCAVTFDDAYREVLTHALPSLRRLGIPAATFVVSGAVDGGRSLLHDRLYAALSWLREAEAPPPAGATRALRPLFVALARARLQPYAAMRVLLESCTHELVEELVRGMEDDAGTALPTAGGATVDRAALRALHAAGVTIGSHTRSHLRLVGASQTRMSLELAGSRRELEAMLGAPVEHFAYPDGDFDEAVVEAVAVAGYRHAYTACAHRDRRRPLLTLPRRMLWEQSAVGHGGGFSEVILGWQTHGGVPWFDLCRRGHGRDLRSAVAGWSRPGALDVVT